MFVKHFFCVALHVAFLAGSVIADSSPSAPETAKGWYWRIQRCGAAFRKSVNKVETDLRRSQLIEQIAKDFDGRSVQFRTKIGDVRWYDGIAEISTESELPYGAKPSPRYPMRVVRSQPIELKVNQAEAAAIRPGEWVEFTGTLIFHPRRWGAVGRSTQSQQLYDVRHEYLGGGYLGTFTSKRYAVTIGGKEVTGRWVEAEVAEE